MFVGGSPQSDARMAAVLEGFRRIHLDASHLSEREIYQGIAGFRKWAERIPFPLVSTNILQRRPEGPLGNPHLIRELPVRIGDRKETFRIAVLGLNRVPKWPGYSMHASQFLVRDPAEAAAFALEEIEGKHDFAVAVTALPLAAARKLAGQVAGIDLILSSAGELTPENEAEGVNRVGSTRIVFSRPQGAEIAEIRLFLEKPEGGAWQVRPEIHRILLEDRYPLDPDARDLVDRTLAEIAAMAAGSPPGANPPKPAN